MEWLGSAALMIGLWLLYLWFFGTTKTSISNYTSPTIRPSETEKYLPTRESIWSVWRQVFSLLDEEVKQLQRNQQELYSCTEDWIDRTHSDLHRLRIAMNKLHSKTSVKFNQVEDVKKKRLSLHPSMSLAFSIQDGTLRM
ncbi:uncharacterized protein Gasu_01130 [Galdieria sulphuraria]|uniref:Uncharacterized protein n=1 Tax=Galdieria sulphuraria TaxID=130081 RepID=M2YA43_GALSU|nr:uncharacterized protein Gasu_01130 [Galdieria sulphuraria]EME32749.1 hypothetical protein Gasu_01130 [Galdieria sulphuraria]|eukprot:XP_005709269.1 hypothetical protein Gasu_01130 [Galdieria sulphuraria]